MNIKSMRRSAATSVAYFITPHGFGHAARAASAVEAMGHQISNLHVTLFTSVPQWFFADTLGFPFTYHPVVTDVGFVQRSPLVADYGKTLDALRRFIPFNPEMVTTLAKTLIQSNCETVLCDIAPLGIAVANKAGIPSILVENFTWDWIYADISAVDARMKPFVDYFQQLFSSATYHIQTEPVCFRKQNAVVTKPVSRRVQTPRGQIRRKLGIQPQQKMVLVTMGGVPDDFDWFQGMCHYPHVCFVLMGVRSVADKKENVIWLPHRSAYHHPDLVNAADLVVGKAGYSTVAEIYHAGVPFAYIRRPHFRESSVLAQFIERHISSRAIADDAFYNGKWLDELPYLLSLPRIERIEPNGAIQIANMMSTILSHKVHNQIKN